MYSKAFEIVKGGWKLVPLPAPFRGSESFLFKFHVLWEEVLVKKEIEKKPCQAEIPSHGISLLLRRYKSTQVSKRWGVSLGAGDRDRSEQSWSIVHGEVLVSVGLGPGLWSL